jgi:DnaJ-class molecular chaperone
MSRKEEYDKICHDCWGAGTLVRLSAITKQRVETTCTRCEGDGLVFWDSDPSASGPFQVIPE